ncbi:hypothetical protein CBQ28_08755 [Pseudoalteromonas sp. GCY]|uniref:hypothetical protein n=1 Tax=Pseudoalteromonas sp. GCY TaxID=2003316 RepID=UPI000BFEB282|nr:hypothetical protein [Pseudoalteromonas sp. GCY]PHI37448.1 hypothetical protein CBQ28_08755 [Pseudoalteromonas sp. GCY]QQQ64840.1 hypothetical protein JJQ94_04330 [Pseudoalteromonas sp. GCY]
MKIEPNLWQLYLQVYFQPIQPTRFDTRGAILSLWNPHGKVLCEDKNQRLSRFWQGALQRANVPYQLLWGGDKQMQYRELSIYIKCDLASGFRWAARLNQLGFYFVENNHLHLYNSSDKAQSDVVTDKFASRLCFVALPKNNSGCLAARGAV